MNFEKKLKIQLACGILWICLGVLACVAAFSGKVSSGYPFTYCAGTGGGLIATGFIQIIKSIHLLKNESLRKKEKIRLYDERNIFIQKQIYSLHSLFSLVLLYVATLHLLRRHRRRTHCHGLHPDHQVHSPFKK